MSLPTVSLLFGDGMKSPCADESPVARVPVTPSRVFDFRVLCVCGSWSPVSGWIGDRTCNSRSLVARRGLHGFPRLARTSGLSTLELSTLDFQLLAVWRLFCRISPLEYALTQKPVCKFFGIRTYKSLDLKSPGMNTYKKHRGGRGVCLLQMLDLTGTYLQTPAFLSLSC